MPQNLRCSIQTVPLNLLSHVSPVGLTAITDITLLVVPPKLKAIEGVILVVFDA